MASTIERRLQRLESVSRASDEIRFMIESDGRSKEELLRYLGILDKPGRKLQVINIQLVSPGPQPEGPLPPNVSPFDSGNWKYEPLHKEPRLCGFTVPGGEWREGGSWVREFLIPISGASCASDLD